MSRALKMNTEEMKEVMNIESQFQTSIVAYLDILGFTNHVKNHLKPTKESHKKILQNYKNAFEETSRLPYIKEYVDLGLIKYKQFSDSTSISIPDFYGHPSEAIIICSMISLTKNFNYHMLKNKFYLRGGISIGFHHENEDIIFSDSLIKAHTLESNAIYPRIVLDYELIKRLKRLWKNKRNEIQLCGMEKMIITDYSGLAFINPFNYTQSMEKMISEGLCRKPSWYNKNKSLKDNLNDADETIHVNLLKDLEDKIDEYHDNNHILKKYLWLKELLDWNMEPESSKIKFEYLLKPK